MCDIGEPTDEQLQLIRTRKPEAPVIEVDMKDGSKKKLWCTFGAQQIDIDPFTKPGTASIPHYQTCSRARQGACMMIGLFDLVNANGACKQQDCTPPQCITDEGVLHSCTTPFC